VAENPFILPAGRQSFVLRRLVAPHGCYSLRATLFRPPPYTYIKRPNGD
jgi:hypothetical protein